MSRMRQVPVIFIQALVYLGLLMAAPGIVFARSSNVEVPEHARAMEFGNGWKCGRGYREINGTCAAVKVPVNGYLTNTSFGRGWDCMRKFQAIDGACVAIQIPVNGYYAEASSGPGC